MGIFPLYLNTQKKCNFNNNNYILNGFQFFKLLFFVIFLINFGRVIMYCIDWLDYDFAINRKNSVKSELGGFRYPKF